MDFVVLGTLMRFRMVVKNLLRAPAGDEELRSTVLRRKGRQIEVRALTSSHSPIGTL